MTSTQFRRLAVASTAALLIGCPADTTKEAATTARAAGCDALCMMPPDQRAERIRLTNEKARIGVYSCICPGDTNAF